MKPTAAPIASQRRVGTAVVVAVTIFAAASVAAPTSAQTPPRPATGASAPATNAPAATSPTTASPVLARKRIELSPADRSAIDKASADSVAASKPDDGLVPTAADLTAPPPSDDRQTRIEQVRTANRISEVIVTPGLGTPSFVMTNRDGRQPLTQTDMGGGLSVPKFFRWEFGNPAPAPLALPPPPPTR